MKPFMPGIRDFEYGVAWNSELVMCDSCGLVAQEPQVQADQIAGLYPEGYLAHTPASRSTGVYGRLKSILGQRAARSVAEYLPPGGVLLEVGCGNGAFLKLATEVRGDVSVEGVDMKDLGVTGVPRFTFHHGQLEELALPAESMDVIYCSNLIEHVANPLEFLAECRRLLKPGGALYGITPDHLSLDRYLFGRFWAGYHYPRHTFVFDHHNIVGVLGRAGFAKPSVKGGYSFWYLSFANRFATLPGFKPRGLLFAAVTALFLPLDVLINLFRGHGSMSFVARKPG